MRQACLDRAPRRHRENRTSWFGGHWSPTQASPLAPVIRASPGRRHWPLAGSRRGLAAAPPPGGAQKYARLIDHQLSWALTDLRRDGLVENPARSVWKLAGAALEPAAAAVEAPPERDRVARLRAMPYRDYLRTPEWRRTRAAALHRAGHACSLDVTHASDLEVHHRTYERLGEELAGDLVVLCRDCHRIHHGHHGHPRRAEPPPAAPSSSTPPPVRGTRPKPKPSLLRRLLAR
jgi:hypothetical protein